MIQSFKDSATQRLWETGKNPKLDPRIIKVAGRKLQMLHYAETINDLRTPPAKHLEALKGDRKGQHSIKVNDQWRICFTWTAQGPEDIEICDYR